MFRLLLTSLFLTATLHAAAAEAESAAPGNADAVPIAKIPDVPPAEAGQFDRAFRRGADFLLKSQNKDGSWGDHRVIGTWNILCPYPDGPLTFKTASTALCIAGLNASPLRNEPAVQQAMTRAEDYLIRTMPHLKRGDALCIYNTWAHTYVLDAMSMRAAALDRNSPRYRELMGCARFQVDRLNELASAKGGWGYLTYTGYSRRPAAEPTSFLTGTVLISSWMAGRTFSLSLDGKVFRRALKFLKSQRTPAGTYVYSLGHAFYPGRPISRHTGSLARTPACDYALRLWEPEAVSLRQLIDGLDRLWSRRGWLTMALHKPTPHESFAQNSGYFFYYGYYYSGMCLDMLPPNKVKRHASLLANDILTRQGDDGSWWDYPLYNYHKFYGTGYALYALSRAWDKLYGTPTGPLTTPKSTQP